MSQQDHKHLSSCYLPWTIGCPGCFLYRALQSIGLLCILTHWVNPFRRCFLLPILNLYLGKSSFVVAICSFEKSCNKGNFCGRWTFNLHLKQNLICAFVVNSMMQIYLFFYMDFNLIYQLEVQGGFCAYLCLTRTLNSNIKGSMATNYL